MTTDPTVPTASPRRRTVGILVAFLVCWALWLGGLGCLRFHHPGLDHGDPTSDANILSAGENFDREGLLASYGVPAIDTVRAEGKQPDHYVTYPPGAYWFHQSLKVCGVHSPEGFRVVSLVVTGLAVLLLFALLCRLSGDVLPAAIACTLYLTARPLLEYADNLHYIGLAQLTLMGALYAWVRFEDARTPRAALAWLAAAGAAFFLDAWLTFEHTLFILAFAAIRSLWNRRPARLLAVALLGAVPVLVLAIRVLMDRAVLGSFDAVWAVLRTKAEQRVGSASTGTGLHALVDAWLPRLTWPGSVPPADSPDAEFSLPLLSWWFAAPAAALLVLAVAAWHHEAFVPLRRALGAGVLLLLAGLTWFLAMTEHAIVHRFAAMLILPGVAAIGGSLIAAGLVQRTLHPAGAPVRCFGRALAIFALIAWIVPLRSSFAVNLAALHFGVRPPNRAVAGAIERREAAVAGFAAAGRSLSDIDRLFVFTCDAPAARALGRPFDNASNAVPGALAGGQALLIPLWQPDARRAAAATAANLGLPDQLAPAIEPYLLFRPGRDAADRVTITTTADLAITRMAWRPTTDRSGWLFSALVGGPLDQLREAGFVLQLHGRDASGARSLLASMPVPDAGGVRDGDTALLRAAFPASGLESVTGVELWAVVPGRPRRSGFDVSRSSPPAAPPLPPPESADWTLTEQAVSWPTPPWRASSQPSPSPAPPPTPPPGEPQPER